MRSSTQKELVSEKSKKRASRKVWTKVPNADERSVKRKGKRCSLGLATKRSPVVFGRAVFHRRSGIET